MHPLFIGSFILLWIIVLLNVLLTLVLVRRVNTLSASATPTTFPSLSTGTQAPEFQAETLDGTPVSLQTYRGHSTFFAFIAPDCTACHIVLPSLNTVAATSTQPSVTTILVSSAGHEQTRQMIDELQLSLPVIIAPAERSSFFRDYKIAGTPAYCFVDEQTIVKDAGYLDQRDPHWKALISSPSFT